MGLMGKEFVLTSVDTPERHEQVYAEMKEDAVLNSFQQLPALCQPCYR